MEKFDVIVAGLGAMGSAALYQLAKRGVRTLGLDRFSPPHESGSTLGDTRITRLAIGEGAHYTPLVMRSHEIWREIEAAADADLLTQCGGLIISSANPASFNHVEGFFGNTLAAAERFGIAHERLDAGEIRRRYPIFNVRDDEYGYFEPQAGFVRPEQCVAAQLLLAEKLGAEIRRNEPMLGFEVTGVGITVTTGDGTYHADRLVVVAGAWLPELLGGPYAKLLRVYRQVLYWFAVDGDVSALSPARFPVFIWELHASRAGVYGFPIADEAGFKIASEQYDAPTTPGDVSREVSDEEVHAMYQARVAPHFTGVSARCTKAKACLYTVAPEARFIIDRHPESERVIVASCCSGHGFKHSAAIGEALSDLALGRESRFDLYPFRLARFE